MLRVSAQPLPTAAEEAIGSRLWATLTTAGIGISIIDVAGKFLVVNRAFCDVLGCSEEEAGRRDFFSFIHPEEREENIRLNRDLLAGKIPAISLERRCIRPGGEVIWVRNSVSLLQSEGENQYLLALIENITDRKKAEAGLAEKATLSALGAEVGEALTRTGSLDDALRICANAFVKHLDVTFARIWTLNQRTATLELRASAGLYMHLDGPHSRVPVGAFKIGQIAQEGKAHLTNDVVNDERVSDRTWARRENMVAFAGYPLLVSGEVVGVLAMFSRRTLPMEVLTTIESAANTIAMGIQRDRVEEERKQSLQREQASRRELETINRLGQFILAELDLSKVIEAITEAATELSGAESGAFIYNEENTGEEEPSPASFRSLLIVPVTSRSGKELGAILLRHGISNFFGEEQRRLVTGLASQASVAIDNARLFQAAEKARAAAEISREETERSHSDLERFAFAASHDLQEPLRMVSAYSQLLVRKFHGQLGESGDVYLEYIQAGTKRMGTLIQDLLSYSRVVHADREIVAVDCNILLGDILASCQSAITEVGASVTHEALPVIRGDSSQIGQLFQNLLTNALKYHRPNTVPTVHFEAKRSGHHWLFSVTDNGIGIPVEFRDQIFVIFKRLHKRSEYPGSGIGLALCKRIVEGAGGHIWVESEPGSGSVFQFTWPADSLHS